MRAAGQLYPSTVMHRRLVAPLYRFTYRIFYLLVDIDRLSTRFETFIEEFSNILQRQA